MKKKNLLLIISVVVFLGLILLLIHPNWGIARYVIAFCACILVPALLTKLLKAFLIPSQWILNNRIRIDGILFMISLTLFISFTNNYEFTLKSIAIDITVGGLLGYFIPGNIYKSYNGVIKRIDPDKLIGNRQILTDVALYKENNTNFWGKLILTGQKLIFIPVDTDESTSEIDLAELKQSVKIRKNKFGIPNGIIIHENLQYSLPYPKLWIKKINAA